MQMSERWGHRKLRLYRVYAELNRTGFNSNDQSAYNKVVHCDDQANNNSATKL